ncbi:heavy-metal-associated domain-containing protein [Clostridium magnum]|uniref:Mercuric reductase n=1 Tax=Clostridium magnum DSM 2767 TaxID=1121326 RepID=A0A162TQ47_9CLOT|nr:heavy metal-associated domain-containing protein [Clostridium magnum]KZL92911.1 mercuric reductase [Clostridium magnum DSM 2767]SHJ16005.1 Copper chaperone CopZ [Clostridium magnum DSM 2767]
MKKRILVEGMKCCNCVKHVKADLEELKGVTSVTVDLDSKTAIIEAVRDIQDNDIKRAIIDTRYQVVSIEEV